MESLTVFNYNNQVITRRNDGFINLTQMCQANGKRLDHWKALKATDAYVKELQLNDKSNSTGVIYSEEGTNGGTWGHPLLAVNLARWIGPKFAVWVDINLIDTSKINDLTNFSDFKEQDNSGFIYLAQASQTRWCKIGISKQPYKRMSSLQTGSPLEITLIHRVFTFDMVALEKSLHDYYAAYSLRGEWFDLPVECIREFPAIANQLDTAIEQVCLPQ